MMDVANTLRQNQTVMLMRPARRDVCCPYADMLRRHGALPIEQPTPEAASRAMHAGCRVGMLIVAHEDDAAQLGRCESLLNLQHVCWIGLIAPELVADLRVRECIATHLFNFMTLPADPEQLKLMLRHAWGMAQVRKSCERPLRELMTVDARQAMVGHSDAMQRLHRQIGKVAGTDASVLITGPSGTGKELTALSIHRQSARRHAPFVAVNCGAIAPQLLQSELFGNEKGAFTGAQQRRIGRIEAAAGGTLFLDEIGDMPLDMQVNLLRFLQERAIVRVGGNDLLAVDVRVIAATHVDLTEAIRLGRFREDLYYRINVVCIATPSLAERGRDIEAIAQHYFTRFSQQYNKRLRGFSQSAIAAMLQYAWPGNVRELINRVQRATVMAEGRFILPEDLGFTREPCKPQLMSLEDARASADQMMIHRALSQARNQISQAAHLLGVSRVTLYRLIEKYNIRARTIAGPVEAFAESGE